MNSGGNLDFDFNLAPKKPRRELFVLLFFFESGLMVSPSGTWGTGSTKVRAGRL